MRTARHRRRSDDDVPRMRTGVPPARGGRPTPTRAVASTDGPEWSATLRIGVPRETKARETRVAATPATVAQLVQLGYAVVVETGAGAGSSFPDDAYSAA